MARVVMVGKIYRHFKGQEYKVLCNGGFIWYIYRVI